jgi:hypothetical protein
MGNQVLSLGRRVLNQNDGDDRYWMGPVDGSSRLPLCWDELLDWAEEASQMFQLYLRTRNSENESVDVLNARTRVGIELQLIPYVFKSKRDNIRNLPSMKYFDRVQFFAENVSIHLRCGDLLLIKDDSGIFSVFRLL